MWPNRSNRPERDNVGPKRWSSRANSRRGLLSRSEKRQRDASAASLITFVQKSVEPGSVIHTDAWLGYEPLQKKAYRHRIVFLLGRRRSETSEAELACVPGRNGVR